MRIEKKVLNINGHILVLRNAEKEDAKTLLPYLKRVCRECKYLSKEPDEVLDLTLEKEESFILFNNESKDRLLVIAEYDGAYVGNSSFTRSEQTRRSNHRVTMGIALYEEFTGLGIGSILFRFMLYIIKEKGYEQAELFVAEKNLRAINLYRKFGFEVVGRIPNAIKYDDGSYSDELYMVKSFK